MSNLFICIRRVRRKEVGERKNGKGEGSGREVVSGSLKLTGLCRSKLLFGWTARAITELADKLAIGS